MTIQEIIAEIDELHEKSVIYFDEIKRTGVMKDPRQWMADSERIIELIKEGYKLKSAELSEK